jgi:hypothetical protein
VQVQPGVFFRAMRIAREHGVGMQQVHSDAHCPL